ncbi:MAG: flagella basal body P-ring formation protein FlgA [Betaproteobacteria bacterium]|nr:flagella basal body P-ring formation protein FlgA [Betaproteobacteria bacterium]
MAFRQWLNPLLSRSLGSFVRSMIRSMIRSYMRSLMPSVIWVASRGTLLLVGIGSLCSVLAWAQPGPPAAPQTPSVTPASEASLQAAPAGPSAPAAESNVQTVTAMIVAQIRALVDRQLRENNFVLPSGARLEVSFPGTMMLPQRCIQPVVEPVPGRKPPGNAVPYVIRCAPLPGAVQGPSLTVAVRVTVLKSVVVAARALSNNAAIDANDLVMAEADIGSAGTDALTNPADAVGRTAIRNIPAGAVIPRSALRLPIAIRSGETVRIEIVGVGFTVSSEATAMQSAATGDTIRLRNSEGQTLSGRLDSRGVVVIDLRRPD